MRRSTFSVWRALPAMVALVLAACGPGRAPQVDVLPPPDTPDTGGPYEVSAVVHSDSSIVHARLRWFVNGDDAPRPVDLVRETGTDNWHAGIPGQPAGAVVRFTVEVEDDEGHLVIRPAAPKANQPVPTYQFRVLGDPAGG